MSNSALYDRDFYGWAREQAGLLREGRFACVDIAHIAEEIESMGRREKRELVSRLTVLLLHLLKWQYQPGFRGNSWRNSVRVQRIGLASHMDDNPSLRSVLGEAMIEAYRVARIEAETETGLAESMFPEMCAWGFEEMMKEDFWPEAGDGVVG